jgi:predicted Co/Zn/Cd cation transporter (cation efflux family)
MSMNTEQGILRLSVGVTLVLAGIGIAFGLFSHSFAIVFDGVYMLVDASMSALALLVTRLIALSTAPNAAGKLQERFNMGLWHLEPMVLGLNGFLLVGAAFYALINAIGSLLDGGRALEFGYAIIYSVAALAGCITMAVVEARANRSIRSEFVALDVKSWIMSAGITAALLIAFAIGFSIEGTRHEWITPYIDPAVLAVVCVVIIPIPAGTIRQSLAEILLVTPPRLRDQVKAVADEIVRRHGFRRHYAYVAKVGRGKLIELYFVVPTGQKARRLEEWDAIRDEVGEMIAGDERDRWLTIAFTTDDTWAR